MIILISLATVFGLLLKSGPPITNTDQVPITETGPEPFTPLNETDSTPTTETEPEPVPEPEPESAIEPVDIYASFPSADNLQPEEMTDYIINDLEPWF